MKTALRSAWLMLTFGLLLSACGSGGNSGSESPTATLPAPQVRVEALPSETAPPPQPLAGLESTPTLAPTAEIQAGPTVDQEEYLIGLIDDLLAKIDRRLNGVDTDIRP